MLTSLDQLIFIFKVLFPSFTKQLTLIRRSIVLNFPLVSIPCSSHLMIVTDNHFHLSRTFSCKVRSLPLQWSLLGCCKALPTNIKLEWKWLTVKKHISLLWYGIYNIRKKFYDTCHMGQCIANFQQVNYAVLLVFQTF